MIIGCFRPNRSGRFKRHRRIKRVDLSDTKRDWMWLPEEILETILSNLVSLHDYIRFGCVCKQWHSVAKHQRQNRMATIHKQVPFLLVLEDNESPCPDTGILYNPARDGVVTDFVINLEFSPDSRLCGSSHGWLAFLEKDMCVTLFNPFTRARISLPRIVDPSKIQNKGYVSSKVILSADPSLYPDDYKVAAFVSNHWMEKSGFIRPGRDKEWTHFNWGKDARVHYWYPEDMLFAEGNNSVYFLWETGLITRAKTDHEPKSSSWERVVGPWDRKPSGSEHYKNLVRTSSGDLLMIVLDFGFYALYSRIVDNVTVLKVQNSSLVEVEDLDGDAIFVGRNHANAVAARDFQGIEANCVYYSSFAGRIGKFNVKDRKSSHLNIPNIERYGPYRVWIFPTMNCKL